MTGLLKNIISVLAVLVSVSAVAFLLIQSNRLKSVKVTLTEPTEIYKSDFYQAGKEFEQAVDREIARREAVVVDRARPKMMAMFKASEENERASVKKARDAKTIDGIMAPLFDMIADLLTDS